MKSEQRTSDGFAYFDVRGQTELAVLQQPHCEERVRYRRLVAHDVHDLQRSEQILIHFAPLCHNKIMAIGINGGHVYE